MLSRWNFLSYLKALSVLALIKRTNNYIILIDYSYYLAGGQRTPHTDPATLQAINLRNTVRLQISVEES